MNSVGQMGDQFYWNGFVEIKCHVGRMGWRIVVVQPDSSQVSFRLPLLDFLEEIWQANSGIPVCRHSALIFKSSYANMPTNAAIIFFLTLPVLLVLSGKNIPKKTQTNDWCFVSGTLFQAILWNQCNISQHQSTHARIWGSIKLCGI